MSDEFNNLHYDSSGKEAGYYFQYSVLNSAEWNQRTRLRQVAQDIDKVIKDTAPDEFYSLIPQHYYKIFFLST